MNTLNVAVIPPEAFILEKEEMSSWPNKITQEKFHQHTMLQNLLLKSKLLVFSVLCKQSTICFFIQDLQIGVKITNYVLCYFKLKPSDICFFIPFL